MGAQTGEALLAALGRDSEAFVAPQAPDTLVVDLAALTTGLFGGATPPPPRSLFGELAQELAQLGLLIGGRRWVEALSFVGGDVQGSVSWMVDAVSGVVSRARYFPFGQVRGVVNQMLTDRGFVGQVEDDSTGLDDLNNRYYDPTVGVFISVDPLVSATGNPYLYAGGNPTTRSDPSGLCAPDVGGAREVCTAAHIREESHPLVPDHPYFGRGPAFYAQAIVSFAEWNAPYFEDSRYGYAKKYGLAASRCGATGASTSCSLDDWLLVVTYDSWSAHRPWAKSLGAQNPNLGKAIGAVALSGIFAGGRFGSLDTGNGIERHHMPADSASPLDRNDGPAIQMTEEDHQMTASWGNSKAAQAWRAQQEELIASGRFDDAVAMDIEDVTSKFPLTYDEAILMMIDDLPGGGTP